MTRRLLITAIVLFWVVMNVALIRLWLWPEGSDILTVPVAHVFKQLFLHEQPSNLAISQSGKRVGGFVLKPRHDEATGVRTVDFAGNLILKLPLMNQQPFAWRGRADLDRGLVLRKLELHFESRAKSESAMAVEIVVEGPEKKLTYNLQQNGQRIMGESVSLDETGARAVLTALGVDPAFVTQAATAGTGAELAGQFKLTARQTQLDIRGDRVEVFRLLLTQAATPLAQIDISQLGQILRVRTSLGYTLAPDELTP